MGSNDERCDEKSAWAILCEDLSGTNFRKMNENKFCAVPAQMNKRFRCLGIRLLASEKSVKTCLQSLRFWEKVIPWYAGN